MTAQTETLVQVKSARIFRLQYLSQKKLVTSINNVRPGRSRAILVNGYHSQKTKKNSSIQLTTVEMDDY